MNIEEIEIALKGAKYNHYGLPVIEIDGAEYAVARSAEEAYAAACKAIGETLWAFDAGFLFEQCGLDDYDEEAKAAFREMTGRICEGANKFIRALIDGTCGFDNFAGAAIVNDGEGNFLATYDGEEIEISDGESKKFFLYRVN